MPRGHKSKVRAREKHRQTRGEAQGAQAPGAEEEGPCTSSSLLCGSARSQDGERPSTSQALPTGDLSSCTPLDNRAIVLVQFLLRKYNMQEPITKADMLKCVTKKYKKHFDEILKKASDLMVLAFGIDVQEVDSNRRHYTLISKFGPSSEARLSGEEIMPKTGFLMTVLCVIFMKGNCASEDAIWEVLNVMEIYDGRRHFVFGDPRKLLTQDLVREKYLVYRQVPNSDPPRYEFLWGPRAHAETSKMKVLQFLAKIHNTVPSAFPTLYEEALRDEEARTRASFAAMLIASAGAGAQSRGNSSNFSQP
ncbi:melanoma-associated antigen B10-like [Nycticebus coucang]|uniref:melanoma-associated antigen B10-like n=1 Tax=Nycticebus coucang TaxID=9470 RepID=UPI00234DB639|nr:melanoma-associated antigen B10-like [Nycticebus coucang]